MNIPKSHPRYESLMQRHLIEEGVREGYVTPTGMIAQGRGEAFDYLLGEKTTDSAMLAEKAAVGLLTQESDLHLIGAGSCCIDETKQNRKMQQSHTRVLSVNGNVAALCAGDVVKLAEATGAKIEINLFYWSKEREKKIAKILRKAGAKKVLGTGKKTGIPGLDSARGRVDSEGIAKADVVFVMLEDGDRTEALKAMGKKVIAIDLNPFSRTAQTADITIVDNAVRALPNMVKLAKGKCSVKEYDNKKVLRESIAEIRKNLF